MNYSIVVFISLLLLTTACVKEAGKISSGNVNTTGGGTTGSTEIPGAPDPLASQAWHLENTGQTTFSTGVGIAGEDVSIKEAIAAGYTGDGVRIAVSDSGTDIDHEDLTGTQLTGEHRNYAVSNSNLWRTTLPYVVDDDAHGTAVAGLIAAEGFNGIGSRGVAYDAKYAAFRFVGDYSNNSSVARTIDQADGDFDIFNYSWGYGQCDYSEQDPLVLDAYKDGVTNLRSGRGAIYVQAAGNSYVEYGTLLAPLTCSGNTNASDDLSSPYKIIVGAVNADGEKSSYSTPGSGLWVSAPGGEYGESEPAMLTTDITGCGHGYSLMTYALNEFNRGNSLNGSCSYTSYMNGTSSATPVLTGVIALMLQANPLLTWRDVKNILAYTSDKVDFDISFPIVGAMSDTPLDHPFTPTGDGPLSYDYDYKWVINNAGLAYSNWYGFGRVNALSAVIEANTYGTLSGTVPTLGTYFETDWADYDSGVLVGANIPENDPNGTLTGSLVASSLIVSDALIVESIQIEVTITHTNPQEIGIILVSPAGTESRVLNYNSGVSSSSMPAGKVLLTNAFYGESSVGTWKIKVVDGNTNAIVGTLSRWKIKINGGF
jgi:subtilisin family serine protease